GGIVGWGIARIGRITLAMAAQVGRNRGQMRQQPSGKGLPDTAVDAEAMQQKHRRRWRVHYTANMKTNASTLDGVFEPAHQRSRSFRLSTIREDPQRARDRARPRPDGGLPGRPLPPV